METNGEDDELHKSIAGNKGRLPIYYVCHLLFVTTVVHPV